MFRRIKRIIVILILLILILFLSVLFWWYKPYQTIQTAEFKIPDSEISLHLDTRSNPHTRSILIQATESYLKKEISPGFQLTLMKSFLPIIFPRDMLFFMVKNPDKGKIIYIGIIDFDRAIKILHLQKKLIESKILNTSLPDNSMINDIRVAENGTEGNSPEKSIQSCAWIGSGLIVSSDKTYLKNMIKKYHPESTGSRRDKNSINLTVNNQSKFLSEKIRYYEDKFEFDIFSSIDQVQSIEIQMNPVNPDKMKGIMIFTGTSDINKDDPLISDVNFFHGVLRRSLRPRGIEFKGTQSYSGNKAEIDFEMTGISNALSDIDNLKPEMDKK